TVGPVMKNAGHLYDARFAAEDCFLLAASGGGLRVWQASTGRPVTPPFKNLVAADETHFSPDGRLVIGIGRGGGCFHCDAATGELVAQRLLHKEYDLRNMTFDSTSRRLVVLDSWDTARLLDLTIDDASLDELRQLADLLAGHRIDETGGYVPVEADSLKESWQTL